MPHCWKSQVVAQILTDIPLMTVNSSSVHFSPRLSDIPLSSLNVAGLTAGILYKSEKK